MLPLEVLGVRISISDPWDFVTENGSFAAGKTVGFSEESDGSPQFRIEIAKPLTQGDLVVSELFARLLHLNDTIERFSSGEEVACNFSNVSGEDWEQRVPDAKMGFIGGLKLESWQRNRGLR